MDITQLLSFAHDNEASDLHLSAGNVPVIRVYGRLKRLKSLALKSQDVKKILYAVMSEEQREIFETQKEIDFAVTYGEHARFRVNAFHNRNGVSAVFRLIPTRIPSFADLSLPPVFENLCGVDGGLVLVTGSAGSGKSTTLASMVDYINQREDRHIITIEDPVEFIHSSVKGLVNQREVGHDTEDFDIALRSAMREDPDVIFLGEMRDYETMGLALNAAETGTLVFSTLHASSVTQAITRIVDSFPSEDKDMARAMLASSLSAIVAQRLLPRKDGKGQVAAFEVLVATPAVRNMIRDNRIPQIASMVQTGAKHGMVSMESSLSELADNDIIEKQAV